jgi:hypothetical protein
LEADWLRLLAIDDTALEFKDARGKMRRLVLKECSKTAYVLLLYPISLSTKEPLAGVLPGVVGRLQTIRLKRGDQLALKRQPSSGHAARYEVTGSLLQPATIACSLPEVFECAQVGERIAIDDGRMGGIIKGVRSCLEMLIPGQFAQRLGNCSDRVAEKHLDGHSLLGFAMTVVVVVDKSYYGIRDDHSNSAFPNSFSARIKLWLKSSRHKTVAKSWWQIKGSTCQTPDSTQRV